MRSLPRTSLVLALCAFLPAGGCTTASHLTYDRPANIFPAPAATVGAVAATDRRKESPRRLATIMGGFGNPLKILDTVDPVSDEVASAFTAGLKARGMLAPDGSAPFRIQLLIRKFDADMIMGSTARIDLDMTVLDAGSGRVVYADSVQDTRSDFAFFATGVFAKIEDLQKLAQTLLDASIDRLLDSPGFRAAVAGPRGTS